jgi:hypothetical protein
VCQLLNEKSGKRAALAGQQLGGGALSTVQDLAFLCLQVLIVCAWRQVVATIIRLSK